MTKSTCQGVAIAPPFGVAINACAHLVPAGTPYEIHVTVARAESAAQFQADCAALSVKAVMLDLQLTETGGLADVMTSSEFRGENVSAYAELLRIQQGLRAQGYDVIRGKLETVPWHPAAPSVASGAPMPEHCYFESHLGVLLQDEGALPALQQIARESGCHLSRNVFKRYPDGSFKSMMTYRAHEGTYESIQAVVSDLVARVGEAGLQVERPVIEFALYDSKVSHDLPWLQLAN